MQSALLVPTWDQLPAALQWKEKLCLLTALSLESITQVDTPVTHHFEAGVYIREMKIPSGTLFIGREHIVGHDIELIAGKATLIVPDGKFFFEPPAKITTKPGMHAVAYIHEDVVCRTYHPNPEESRDVDALEAAAFEPIHKMIELGRHVKTKLVMQ